MKNLMMMASVLAMAGCGEGFNDASLSDELWTAIDGYESWSQVSPWDGIQPSADGTHGAFVQIWFNPTATADWGGTISDGGIVVKKGYEDADGATPKDGITVMYKVEGYNSDSGDWYYAKFDDSGVATNMGAPAGCTGCHASGTDSLRTVTDSP